MRRADDTSTQTPIPTVVEVNEVPRARDSARNFAVETSVPEEGATRRSRGLIKRLIVPTVVAAGVVVGPNAFYAAKDSYQAESRAAMARVEAEPIPDQLQIAQRTAAAKLFGIKGEAINVDEAQRIANERDRGEKLNANSYINPKYVSASKDGSFFTVEGKDYHLVRKRTKEGDVYILAGQQVTEDGIIGNRERLLGMLMMGGAKNDASSDLNKDGTVTPEEVTESADISAKHNLERAFQPPLRIVVGQADGNKK